MELNDFLVNSPVAKKIKLTGRIVIHRSSYSPAEIAMVKNTGSFGTIPREEALCELEVNGEVIAKGQIIKKAGDFYFKVKELNKEVTT